MSPGKFLASLLVVIICSAGGFGLVQWLQPAPTPVTVAVGGGWAAVVSRLTSCQGFNQSIDEEIAQQDRSGHGHNSVRLASLKRDCTEDDQEYFRAAPR